jgi:hypothetical protein
MAISFSCDCGKKLTVRDDMAGKRAKCPGCGSVLHVPEENSAPRKAAGGKKKGGMAIWIFAGAAVLFLGFCCVSSAALGGWWFFLRGPSLDPRVVGKWTADSDSKSTSKNPKEIKIFIPTGDIEFKSDGTVVDKSPLTPFTEGKWKTVSSKGDSVTVEVNQSIMGVTVSKQLEIKVVDANHLTIIHPDTKQEYNFKRAT